MNAIKSYRRPAAAALVLACCAVLAACGTGGQSSSTAAHADAVTGVAALPGTGRPPVTVGDKNFTEQFLLGELYLQALQAQGYTVSLNRNIGPTEVSFRAVASGRLSLYPEYLDVWDDSVAGYNQPFTDARDAYRAGQHFARANGMELLTPTPFSDTEAIGLTRAYARMHHLRTIKDLWKVAPAITLGAPQQFQHSPTGLPEVEQAYGFTPAAVKSLDIGAQYQALDQGTVQAAYVNTTDGQLSDRSYQLLGDPMSLFGVGNVVPVVSQKVIAAEGPAFAGTINAVSRLLNTRVMRELNAQVDVDNKDPAMVAKQFLQAHGLAPASPS